MPSTSLTTRELQARIHEALMLWRSDPQDIALPGAVCNGLTRYLWPFIVEWIAACGGQVNSTPESQNGPTH